MTIAIALVCLFVGFVAGAFTFAMLAAAGRPTPKPEVRA